jgi:O-antigen/teichoic acid export membrane protein
MGEDKNHKGSFFRQSGWLMVANIVGGALNWGVHFLQKALPPNLKAIEYGDFGVFLSVAMVIPTMSFQMVMAHQTALALATNRQRELTRLIRRLLVGSLAVWALASIIVLMCQQRILEHWQVQSPVGLWVTLVVVLFSIWMPLFWGLLQGEQSFFSLGWSMMANGGGRLLVGLACVFGLLAYAHNGSISLPGGSYAAAMMVGAALGMIIATVMAALKTRPLWQGPSAPFAWRALAAEAIPPMLGFAAFQFLFTADQMFVKSYYSEEEAGYYFGAGTLSRALMWAVGPLAAVMFPRIVHSKAKAEKTNLVTLVLAGTALLAGVGAIGLTVLGPYIVPIVYSPKFVHDTVRVLPWYAGAMVPLSVANVLLSNLLAKSSFKVVAPVFLLAIVYGFALKFYHTSDPVSILQILCVANLLLLLICGFFSWLDKKVEAPAGEAQFQA